MSVASTAERHAELRADLGLDKPLLEQYAVYISGVLQGDLGRSIVTKQPVAKEFFTLFPATVELSVCAMLFALLVGLPAGIVAAVRRGSAFDHVVMGAALTGYSMPIFWWGLLLIILFSGILGWTPVSGRVSLLYFFEPVTGFMLIDSAALRSEGRLWLGAASSHTSGGRAWHHPAGGHRPPNTLRHARGPE